MDTGSMLIFQGAILQAKDWIPLRMCPIGSGNPLYHIKHKLENLLCGEGWNAWKRTAAVAEGVVAMAAMAACTAPSLSLSLSVETG